MFDNAFRDLDFRGNQELKVQQHPSKKKNVPLMTTIK